MLAADDVAFPKANVNSSELVAARRASASEFVHDDVGAKGDAEEGVIAWESR